MMSEEPEDGRSRHEQLSRRIARKEARKMRARRQKDQNIWFGLGTFGLVGWSVAIPTVLGVALGIWIDNTWPGRYSWTLMLLLIGLMVGCLNAWYWVSEERQAIERSEQDDDS